MEFIRKQKAGFWAYLIVAVMTIVSLAVYISNVTSAYYADMNRSIVIMMVCAFGSIAVMMAISEMTYGKIAKAIADAFRVAAAVLIIMSGVTFIGMRVESFGYIFGSNLELGNEAAFRAGTQAITGIILFVVTWLLALIASFLEIRKKEN